MKITNVLSTLLASQYVLYLKIQNFHWNITGKDFVPIHTFTEKLYTDLAGQVDETAERIRILGEKAPATFGEYLNLSFLEEFTGKITAEIVFKTLIVDYSTLCEKIKEMLADVDDGTADLLTQYLSSYEKTLWMLRSSL